MELCHFACYLLSGLHGVFLIRETKSKAVKPIIAAAPETRRRIPSLEGSSDPFSSVTDELKLVEDNLIRAIRSREQTLTDIAAHLICGGGKRVRPMVTLLAFLAFGGKRTQDIVDIATAIEPLASTAFVRFQLWKLRFPETQNIRFQLADLCYVANFEIETVGY